MGIIKFIESVCVQPAVYWPAPEIDGFGGIDYGSPEQRYVRWEDKAEVVVDSEGREIVSRAEVMTPEDMDIQGKLWLGELTSLSESQKADPKGIEGAYEIKTKMRSPLFRSIDEFVMMVYL